MLLLAAVWLVLIGYTLTYVGYNTLSGRSVSFQDALSGKTTTGSQS